MPTPPLRRSLALGLLLGLSATPALAVPVLERAPATASVAPSPEALAARAERDLLAGKVAEAGRAMTPLRAARMLQEEEGAFYQEVAYMGPSRLRELARVEPRAVDRFGSVLDVEQQAWLRDVNQALAPFQVRADGPVKTWASMLGKLDRNTESNRLRGRLLADGSPVPASPGDLHDLTRARVNTPSLDPALLHRMVEHVQAVLPEKRPLSVLHFVVKDYATPKLLQDPAAPYKGRIHLIVEDVTGGIKHRAFELQLGPGHLTEYWDRHFKVQGTHQDFDIHDAVYKGIGALSRPEHLERLGRAMNPDQALSPSEAVAAGRRTVDAVIQEYQRQLNSAVDQAIAGTPRLDYAATAHLREQIGAVFRALEDMPDLPEGLQPHEHPPL